MKRYLMISIVFFTMLVMSACGSSPTKVADAMDQEMAKHLKIGVVLPDVGLGDQSFNDLAIEGLVKAQEELDIVWNYSDLTTNETIEDALNELMKEHNDIIIGVGYSTQEMIEKAAKANPTKRFMLVDTVSDVKNIDSISFKENEGSYLAGVVAAKTTKTNVLGFVGGMEDDIIKRFYDGFKEGAQSINRDIQVIEKYANTYEDAKLGADLASEMITLDHADVLYAAAGYTGVGLLQEAQKQHVYAIGVDSDQYFYAEKAVITSMIKNIDIAVFDYVKSIQEDPTQGQIQMELGIKEDGVGIAPVRILPHASNIERTVDKIRESMFQ
jgi:basic membrane protein A and related proteins